MNDRWNAVFLLLPMLMLTSIQHASGNNNFFLPGDAFFPTVITAEDLARLESQQDAVPTFSYESYGGYDGAFCGCAGYYRAKVSGLDAAFAANLKKAYDRIRAFEPRELVERFVDGKKSLVETNGVRVLFYPQSFSFPKFEIGLRYNENWVEETTKFGHPIETIRLCCLVDDKEAVECSWRDATRVDALPASLPEVTLRTTPRTEAPITIEGPIKAIVLNSQPLTDYFHPEPYTVTVHIVDSAGVVTLQYEEGEWKEVQVEE